MVDFYCPLDLESPRRLSSRCVCNSVSRDVGWRKENSPCVWETQPHIMRSELAWQTKLSDYEHPAFISTSASWLQKQYGHSPHILAAMPFCHCELDHFLNYETKSILLPLNCFYHYFFPIIFVSYFLGCNFITFLSSLSPSKPSYIPLLALLLTHGLFFINFIARICAFVYTYVFLCITCRVHIMLPVYMFQGWTWTFSTEQPSVCSSLGRASLLLPIFLNCLKFFV